MLLLNQSPLHEVEMWQLYNCTVLYSCTDGLCHSIMEYEALISGLSLETNFLSQGVVSIISIMQKYLVSLANIGNCKPFALLGKVTRYKFAKFWHNKLYYLFYFLSMIQVDTFV